MKCNECHAISVQRCARAVWPLRTYALQHGYPPPLPGSQAHAHARDDSHSCPAVCLLWPFERCLEARGRSGTGCMPCLSSRSWQLVSMALGWMASGRDGRAACRSLDHAGQGERVHMICMAHVACVGMKHTPSPARSCAARAPDSVSAARRCQRACTCVKALFHVSFVSVDVALCSAWQARLPTRPAVRACGTDGLFGMEPVRMVVMCMLRQTDAFCYGV